MLRGGAAYRAVLHRPVRRRSLATAAGNKSSSSSTSGGPRLSEAQKAEMLQRFLDAKRSQAGAGRAPQAPPRASSSAAGSSNAAPRQRAPPLGRSEHGEMMSALSSMIGKEDMNKFSSMLGGKDNLASMAQMMGGGGAKDLDRMMGLLGLGGADSAGKQALNISQQMAEMYSGLAERKSRPSPQPSASKPRTPGSGRKGEEDEIDALRKEFAAMDPAAISALKKKSEDSFNDLRKHMGGKSDPLATLASRASRGDDPTNMLGREDTYVRTPQEAAEAAMESMHNKQLAQDRLELLKQSSIRNAAKMSPQLLSQLEEKVKSSPEEEVIASFPIAPPVIKPLAPSEMPSRFGPRKLASAVAAPAGPRVTMPPLSEPPQQPQMSPRDPRLAFRSRTGAPVIKPDEPEPKVVRGDEALRAKAMITEEVERNIAQATKRLAQDLGAEEKPAEEEDEIEEDTTGQPWVIKEGEPLLPVLDYEDPELAAIEEMEKGMEKSFKPSIEAPAAEAKGAPEGANAVKQEAGAKPADANKDEKNEWAEEEEGEDEFTEEDYLMKPPSNAAEAAALADLKSRRDPEHIKRRRAQVKKTAEKLAEELNPRDAKGQLRWLDELDEADEIVQEAIQELQDTVKEGPTEALEAFSTHEFEGQLALVALWAVEERLPYCFLLLQKFYERFPDSVYPPRAVMAGLIMRLSHEKSDQEAAATAARMHLAATFIGGEYEKYRTADTEATSLKERLIREGIDRSAAVMAEYYARLGARNFAKQLLDYFSAFPRNPDAKKAHDELKQTWTSDLLRPDLAALNQRWDEFIHRGKNAKLLNNMCLRDGLVQTATRIKIHAARFEENPAYKIDLSDMWHEVWQEGEEAEPTLKSLIEQLDSETAAKLEALEKMGKEL